jgi:urea transport system substrate-binding protein
MAGDNSGTTWGSASRRTVLKGIAAAPAAAMLPRVALAAAPATSAVNTTGLAVTDDSVTVGILHSVTGTMAISETGSVEAEKLAIAQINEQGGVLGRKIKFVQEDGASDWPTFAEKAKKLLARWGNGPAHRQWCGKWPSLRVMV